MYAGIGYHLDYYNNIKDELLDLDSIPRKLTPHYIYSEKYDFNTSSYVISGLSLNFVFDSRDNLMNPYKGYFVNINYRYNPTFLGSDQNSSSLWMELRTYLRLSFFLDESLFDLYYIRNIQKFTKTLI